MRNIWAATLSTLMVFSLGCSTLQPSTEKDKVLTEQDLAPFVGNRISNSSRPARIAVVWTNNILKGQGKNATRGFTGRVYFYDHNDELLQVDGELVVYGYDDSQYNPSDVPDHVYKFPPENFQNHYNPTEIGHSYAVWIPWPQENGYRKSISLFPTFKTSSGIVLHGNLSRLTLPGEAPPFENWVEKKVVKQPASAQIGDRPTKTRPEIDQFKVPYGLAQKWASQPPKYAPQDRLPPQEVLQHLTDMESNELNPGGANYNRTHFANTQIGGKPTGDSQIGDNPVSHNIGDTSNLPVEIPRRSIQTPPNPRLGAPQASTFGKPGRFR